MSDLIAVLGWLFDHVAGGSVPIAEIIAVVSTGYVLVAWDRYVDDGEDWR